MLYINVSFGLLLDCGADTVLYLKKNINVDVLPVEVISCLLNFSKLQMYCAFKVFVFKCFVSGSPHFDSLHPVCLVYLCIYSHVIRIRCALNLPYPQYPLYFFGISSLSFTLKTVLEVL